MRVLVTGGSGFIGTNLIDSLLKDNIEVINLDIACPKIESHRKSWRCIDIRDRSRLNSEFLNFSPTHLVHLAARTDLMENGSVNDVYSSNILGVENIIYCIKNLESPQRLRAIFTSSRLVFSINKQTKGDFDYCPNTLYGESKVLGELLVRREMESFGNWIIVRPTSIWGPWFNEPYYNFFKLIRRGMFFYPGNLKVLKSYGYVKNTIHQIRKILSIEKLPGRPLYLADEALLLSEWSELIREAFKAKKIRRLPVLALKAIAIFGDINKSLSIKFPLTTFRLTNLTSNLLLNIDETKKCCGINPFDLRQGVDQTVEWIKYFESADEHL